MVHQQSKIFYRSEAGKLKRCQWWNTDYTLWDKWFTSRVRGYNQCFITDIFLVFLLHSFRISYSAGEPFVPEGIISVPSKTSFMSVMKHWLFPRGQMVHLQSKIFYRSGAGNLLCWWTICPGGHSQCFITDIFLVFLFHFCSISYSAGEPFVPEGIISVSSLTSF
jgi:hypothetical protein